ncbi:nitric oxide synthase oxygenase [Bacillus sp. SL00103]
MKQKLLFLYAMKNWASQMKRKQRRLHEIKQEIDSKGTYILHKRNWRTERKWHGTNSNDTWSFVLVNLHVHDCRHVKTEEEVKEALFHHIEYATNDGKIKPSITIFPPENDSQKEVIIYNQLSFVMQAMRFESGINGDEAS